MCTTVRTHAHRQQTAPFHASLALLTIPLYAYTAIEFGQYGRGYFDKLRAEQKNTEVLENKSLTVRVKQQHTLFPRMRIYGIPRIVPQRVRLCLS